MTEQKQDTVDVLVVGGGPVGLLLGCELARRGVAVRVIDKKPANAPTGGAWPGAVGS
jgi:2-polyprenyl-6-methoxyphenol hydroxylase-like FAD-dependent oxidoreductase